MDPRHPSFLAEPDPVDPDPEEPLEVPDYYEALEAEWLKSDGDEELDRPVNPVDPHKE